MSASATRQHAARGGPQPAFLITIDTEGDNLWGRPKQVTTENLRFLPRFQQLCESYGLKPTYLTDFDAARSDEFVEFGRDAVVRGRAEIGMHLHAWNTPPLVPLTGDDDAYQPYLMEYPEQVLRDKVALMTNLLSERFGAAPRSHRAGRWAFNCVYARALVDHGYEVDCSVTPYTSWSDHGGNPAGAGGSDYRGYPARAYFVDTDDISRPGDSPLLEVPVSIMPCRIGIVNRVRERCSARSLVRRGLNRFYPPRTWFRPTVDNLEPMLAVMAWVRREGFDYIEFMLHSSELMPGGSPNFAGVAEIERLYENLATLFAAASGKFVGATLSEYRVQFASAPVGTGT